MEKVNIIKMVSIKLKFNIRENLGLGSSGGWFAQILIVFK